VSRLGAYGWLAPPDENVLPNIGLLDIRAALHWVKAYISLFGGNPNAVTAMGESAGSGSIMHLITAYGGERDPPPFQRVSLRQGLRNHLAPWLILVL